MEQHKNVNLTDVDTPILKLGAKDYFSKAHIFANHHYSDVIDKIWSTKFDQLSPERFFEEYVWVVYTSGFSAKAVTRFFDKLLDVYGHFSDLSQKTIDEIMPKIGLICNNEQKAKSVVCMAGKLQNGIEVFGWKTYRDGYLSSPELLMQLPYVGKITKYHLARNIGLLDVVKPDLHLVRAAKYWGYSDCIEMCKDVQPKDMPLGIVDLILWFSMSTFGTKEID